jgi:hypothetical protein
VGYDYPADEPLRLDPENPNRFAREQHTTHAVFFPRGIGVIEYLANLREIRAERWRSSGRHATCTPGLR